MLVVAEPAICSALAGVNDSRSRSAPTRVLLSSAARRSLDLVQDVVEVGGDVDVGFVTIRQVRW